MLTISLYKKYAFISLLYKQLLKIHAVEIFHCTIRFINQISKEVPHETCILYLFHKNVHENTFALTLPCFIWVSRAIAKHAPHRSYCFLSLFKLRCKRHYRNLATYSWCTTWRENVTKTAPARRQHSVGCGGAPISYDRRRRRQQNVGGGGAAAAAHSSTNTTTIPAPPDPTTARYSYICPQDSKAVILH